MTITRRSAITTAITGLLSTLLPWRKLFAVATVSRSIQAEQSCVSVTLNPAQMEYLGNGLSRVINGKTVNGPCYVTSGPFEVQSPIELRILTFEETNFSLGLTDKPND